MMKSVIRTLSPTLRLVRFNKDLSPSWINQGTGWTPDAAVEASSALGLEAIKVDESDTSIMYRVQRPKPGRLKYKELVPGLEVICDDS